MFLIIIFEKQRLKPRTNKMFDMFDPITFPIESSGDLLIIASIDTSNSGNEVPKPTTIIPTKKFEILYFFPSAIALDSNRSAPLTTKDSPIIKSTICTRIISLVFYQNLSL